MSGIDNTLKLIEDNKKLSTSIQTMYELPYELPYLMDQAFELLEDDAIFKITDSNKLSLCYMLDMYFGTGYLEYMTDLKLDNLLSYGRVEIYKVETKNGIRYATENEVLHGVKGLIPEYIYPAGEEAFKKLSLLQWTFSGVSYYFRSAGFKLQYDSDGKVVNPVWELFEMSAVQLKEMMDWIRSGNQLEKAVKILRKFKRAGGFKYAKYEPDEIEETITVKQLIYNILHTFPRGSTEFEYKKALSMAIGKSKGNRMLTPYEISELRRIYEKYAMDKDRDKLIKQSIAAEGTKLADECKEILKYKGTTVLNSDEFVYKIISTLSKNGYKKCSYKQHKFIEEALEKIKQAEENAEANKTEVISEDDIDTSLEEMYAALGTGVLSGE